MLGFIFGVLCVLASLIIGIACLRNKKSKMGAAIIIPVGVLIGGFAIVFSCITSVATGHTGVVTTFGYVENYTYDAGIHFKAPWRSVVEMDNRVQKATVPLECFSSDIQEVTCTYTVNYQISKANAQDIYKTVGISYYDTVVVPNVQESVKTIMAHYTAENLIGNRDALAREIETLLADSLSVYHIEVVSSAIEDMDFTDAFTTAVEAKQVAAQNKLKATTEQEQKTMEAEQEAKRKTIEANAAAEIAKIQAQADLEVQKINADAAEYTGQKEAAKNKAINESLTANLIQYYYIMQWDGKLPTTVLGDSADVLLDLSQQAAQ